LTGPAGSAITAGLSSVARIKQGYERFPYPGTDRRALAKSSGSMPALAWMQAVGRPGAAPIRRVLVAGCGTGAEAFGLREKLPKVEIVAVDFSPRSIAVARRRQREMAAEAGTGAGAGVGAGARKPITFLVGDLTDARLAEKLGGDFDLITCHGVLSYIPQPGRALKTMAGCLAKGGALYLGVNGAGHPATALRPWLEKFGVAVDTLRDERRVRELLRLWDALHDDDLGELATMPASYLASDVCGAWFNNWTLAKWRTEARRGGWEVAGTAILPAALRLAMEGDRHVPLYPAGVGELAERLDDVRPAGFHRIMLRRAVRRGAEPSLRWTGLYTVRVKAGAARFFAGASGVRFDTKLTTREAALLGILLEEKIAPTGWVEAWTRSEAGRKRLWEWEALGVVAGVDSD